MTLPLLPTSGLDDPNARRRVRETINNVLTFKHDDSRVRTAAEISAGVTPTNYAYPTLYVKRYGASLNDSADDLAAWNAAISVAETLGGGIIMNEPGALSVVSGPVIVQHGDISSTERGIVIDLNGGRIRTTANSEVIRVGAASGATTAWRGNGVRNGTLRGTGASDTSCRAIIVRNHSFGVFENLRFENFGARPLLIQANERGVQYNLFKDIEITGNHAGAFTLDTQAAAGGYINDNTFINIRAHENPNAGSGIVHVTFIGSQPLLSNRFYAVAIETQGTTDTLLDIDNGSDNHFDGIRLDGAVGTTAVNIASGCDANIFLNPSMDGAIVDASNRSFMIWNEESGDFPRIRVGSLAAGNQCWDFGLFQPSSTLELHIAYRGSDGAGFVRFPNETPVLFGNREGGDNGQIEIDGEARRLQLRTLGSTAIGSGPFIRFEGQFSSSGDMANVDLRQVGLRAIRYLDGRVVSSVGTFANGDTTPSVAASNFFLCANTGATSITDFDDEIDGHQFTVLLDANTTIVHGTPIKLAGGANLTGTANDTVTFVTRSSVHYEIARSVNG